MKKIQEQDVKNKNVLIRIDTDVSVEDGLVQNDRRLKVSVPTLRYLIENGANITIIGHIGRPKGKEVEELKMRPVEDKLIELLGTHQNWQLLENLRFNKGEEENDADFAAQLAAGQDLFVQDAFATCHRRHASTAAVTQILSSYAGLSVQNEVEHLIRLLENVKSPYTIIMGGAKIADKLPVLKNLATKADNFLIGGAIANTFLAARRHQMGKSLVDENDFREANIIWQNLMDDPHRNLFLPQDLVMSRSIEFPEEVRAVNIEDLLKPDYKEYASVDIGPKTVRQYQEVVKKSKTVFWNGCLGVSEVAGFEEGTSAIATAVAESGAQVVIGGGDTVAAVEKLGIENNDNIYLSTGGGATLEFLAGKVLPGLEALE
jgi:phosphoglycerate kinase